MTEFRYELQARYDARAQFYGKAIIIQTGEELDQIETYLDDMNPDGMSETEVNDFFWFEDDEIAEILGYNSWDDLLERDEDDEEEEEDESDFDEDDEYTDEYDTEEEPAE